MPRLRPKTKLYRNFDQEFERVMQKKSAERKMAVAMALEENNFGFTLTLTDEDDNSISVTLPYEKAPARTPQAENLRNQLGKLGNTPLNWNVWIFLYRATGLFLRQCLQIYVVRQWRNCWRLVVSTIRRKESVSRKQFMPFRQAN